MSTMTNRQRLIAILQRQELDRVPFIQYDGLAAPTNEIWSVLGRANFGILSWVPAYRIETPNCTTTSEEIFRDGLRGIRNIIRTPAGSLEEEKLFEPTFGTASIRKHYLTQPSDYEILARYLKDMVITDNNNEINRVAAQIGEDGLPHAFVPRTPYQQLWVQWVSIEDLVYHMVDCPERVQECIDIMSAHFRQILEIAVRSPAPYICIPDNITAPAIGRANFDRYCLPLYRRAAELFPEDKRPVFVHMDGDLMPLWESIGASGISGLDSLSPPPDNDTSVAQAAGMWPWMRIFVNFPSSVHLKPEDQIRQAADRILAGAGHTGQLTIQISENVPPGAWRRSFPIIARAIEDFGKP